MTKIGWSWAIIEYVSEVRSAARAPYLVPCHTNTGIGCFGDFVFGKRCIKTGPTGVGFKFCLRAKELVSARGTEINSSFVIVPILILVWRLGLSFAEDLKLAGS